VKGYAGSAANFSKTKKEENRRERLQFIRKWRPTDFGGGGGIGFTAFYGDMLVKGGKRGSSSLKGREMSAVSRGRGKR